MSGAMIDFLPFYMNSLFEWIKRSGHLPILVVDSSYPNINFPIDNNDSNCILINTFGESIDHLTFASNGVTFIMRCDSAETEVFIPIEAVIGFMPSGLNTCYRVNAFPVTSLMSSAPTSKSIH